MDYLQGSFTCPLCHREFPIEAKTSKKAEDDHATATLNMSHVVEHLNDHARIERVYVETFVDYSFLTDNPRAVV